MKTQEKTMNCTPGPWTVRSRDDGSLSVTGAYHIPKGMPAAVGGFLSVCELSGDEHHDKANARLIAAAPALLAATRAALIDLVTVTALTGSQDAAQPTIDALRAAIAAAEGR